jgi:serine/threonine protein kinase
MESSSDDSAAWIKPGLPSSSQSSSISKALSARLEPFDIHSSHLSLLNRLMRVILIRSIPEVNFLDSKQSGIFLGGGATFEVEKRWLRPSFKESSVQVAAKRARVVVPKQFTAGLRLDDEAYRRLKAVLFELEVLSHSRIRQHKNIAPLIGYSWDETISGYAPMLAMELATLGNGRSFLSSTQLSDREKIDFCGDIALGLDILHICSIVHGDVKLENILVYPGSSSRFVAKISDFEGSPQNGDEGLYRGTKIYNAPEVQHADNLNQHIGIAKSKLWLCDAFAFGLLTLEVLSGASWYGDLQGGHDLVEQVLNGCMAGMSLEFAFETFTKSLLNCLFLEADAVLQMGLELAETLPRTSPALRTICRRVLEYTLPSMLNRMSGGWRSVLLILRP